MEYESQREKEKLHNMMHFTQRFLDNDSVPDLQEITEFMRTLTGGFCAVFNQYEDKGMGFTTEAIAVKTQHLLKAIDILGFNPIGKRWSHDPNRQAKIQQEMVTLFENLHSLTGKTIPVQLIRLLETIFDIGQVAIVKTMKKDKAIGDFTLMMPRGTPMESQELAILYATQVGMHLDRVQHEQHLKESELKHRRLFETMSPGVIYRDFDGSIISANPAAERMLGITFDQMQGKASIDPRRKMIKEDGSAVPGKEYPSMIALRTGKKSGPVTRGVFIPEIDDYIWLSITAIPLFREGEEKPFQSYAIFDDVTERKRAEEKLQESEIKYRTLFNQSVAGIYLHDLEGRILDVNQEACLQLGYSRDELLKMDVFDLHPNRPETVNIPKDELLRQWNQWQSQQRFSLEAEHLHKDGTIIPIQLSTGVIFDKDKKRILAITQDITERKKAEEKLKEYAHELETKNRELDIAVYQAEEANQAKSRYLAHMNHEIRVPLNGFVGFLYLMEKTRLDEEQQEYIDYMKQSTSHILSIINNVLDMARIEAGEMQLTNRIFNLAEEIQTALAPLHSLAMENNIHLQVKMDSNLPHQVEGDPDRLRQIILNMGGNAVKFTRKGQVHIAIGCPETNQDHHTLQLVVEDTGRGMTRETLDKLFLPFYQADDGSTPQSKGTGLGMPITRELVELMDGQIQVDSTPGKGTRIKVLLLLRKAADSHEDGSK